MDSITSLINQVRAQGILLKEIATLTYEELENHIYELNQLSYDFKDGLGRRLVFVLKKVGRNEDGSLSLFWKAQIQVSCAKVSVTDGNLNIVGVKVYTLRNFLKIYKTIKSEYEEMYNQVASGHVTQEEECSQDLGKAPLKSALNNAFNACEENLDECCICMERKPEILLPCAHSFCTQCIQEWNTNQKTCPVCRTDVEYSQDSWVLSEVPQPQEIYDEIQKTLSSLVHDDA